MIFRPKAVVTVQIEGNIAWSVAQDPDSGAWIGVCEPLNLNAIGDTWIEFQQAAAEAMHVLFLDLFEEGELTEFLRHNQWTLRGSLPAAGTKPRFDVPFDVRRASMRDLVAAGA